MSSAADAPGSRRRWLLWLLRALILALVCLGVSGTVRGALAQLAEYEWQVRSGWLIAAGALYAVGLSFMGWFWHRALAALGQPAPWGATMRAYFLGHLGKYVPGKAMAVILRVAAVRKWVTSLRIALVSSLLETLTMMAVGAFLAGALALVVLRLEPRLAALAAAMAVAAGVPTLPPIARRLARVGMTRIKQKAEIDLPPSIPADVDASLHGINFRLLGVGWLAGVACWTFLALSLYATLRAIGVDDLHAMADLPRLIAAVAFAVVAGFLSMLPGGLVVRDALLMQLLAPLCGKANALVAAVLLRLVWLVTEVAVCGILYIVARAAKQRARSSEQGVD